MTAQTVASLGLRGPTRRGPRVGRPPQRDPDALMGTMSARPRISALRASGSKPGGVICAGRTRAIPASGRPVAWAAMSAPTLKRHLGLLSATMVVVGSVIGSGIFYKPLDIAQSMPDVPSILACWAVLGVICLFGAFAYGELGAMLPEAGGQFAFLREAYGPFVAFLYGWCLLLVINTGTLAALAVAFAGTVGRLVALPPAAELGLGAAMVLSLAAVNHFGVRWGALLQNVSTLAKLGALGAIVLGGYLIGQAPPAPPAPIEAAPIVDPLSGLITACVAVFWAYEGWYQLPFSAAELKNPARDLPRGLILGVLILIVTYVAVNAVYLHLIPLTEMRALDQDIEVPQLALQRIVGPGGATLLLLLIALSVYGAGNPNLLSTPRALYAMAREGLAFPVLTRIHPIHRTPTVAIWFQALWSLVLLIVLETFRDITEFVIFAALIFYGLSVAAVYVLRWRLPTKPRPYRCLGYPLTPALFIAAILFVDVQTLMIPEKRANALYGLLIIAAGIPAYLLIRRRRGPR